MCGSPPMFNFTEEICEDCKEQDHSECDEYRITACACRNSDHTLGDPKAFYEFMMQGGKNGRKDSLNV